MSRTLILASESPYRRELLDRLGLAYEAHAHRCDERALPLASDLESHALQLAAAKACSLAEIFPNCFIIGSDQIAEIDGKPLHKPETMENACEQLANLQGRAHRLLTAVALRYPDGRVESSLEVHRMHMRALGADEIQRYLSVDLPLDCCGSYKIERLGITLMERIEGDDFTAITGLPLIALTGLLRAAGWQTP